MTAVRSQRGARATALAVVGFVLLTGLLVGAGLAASRTLAAVEPSPPSWLVVGGDGLLGGAAGARGLPLPGDVTSVHLPGGTLLRNDGRSAGDIILALRARDDLATYDHIVVQAGERDQEAPPATVRVGLAHLLDYLAANAAPDAHLAVVGPLEDRVTPSDAALQINAAMRSVAEERDVDYVDTPALQLYRDAPAALQRIALALEQRLGWVEPPVATTSPAPTTGGPSPSTQPS